MRRFIVLLALGPILLGLGACGGPEKDPNGPPPPDVAANFSQPIDARGIEPSWGLKIRGTQLTLDRANQPSLAVTAPGAVITAHEASWTATLPDSQAMKVTVYASPCSDGATGASYPFSAEVELPGAAPLTGCAGRPAAAAKKPYAHDGVRWNHLTAKSCFGIKSGDPDSGFRSLRPESVRD
jgi:uncharacterized membrane protein